MAAAVSSGALAGLGSLAANEAALCRWALMALLALRWAKSKGCWSFGLRVWHFRESPGAKREGFAMCSDVGFTGFLGARNCVCTRGKNLLMASDSTRQHVPRQTESENQQHSSTCMTPRRVSLARCRRPSSSVVSSSALCYQLADQDRMPWMFRKHIDSRCLFS